jgi:Retrotransposon gag protein/Zinc knuckle
MYIRIVVEWVSSPLLLYNLHPLYHHSLKLRTEDLVRADTVTWNQFKDGVVEAFEDKTASDRARNSLDHLYQRGTMTIDDYINQFDSLCQDCSLDSDVERIRLVDHHVKPEIVKAIVSAGRKPDKYDHYRSRVLEVGRMFEQFHQQQQSSSHPSARRFPQNPIIAHRPTTRPPVATHPVSGPARDRVTPHGVTYAGRGRPMDIDQLRKQNRCFNCQEVGHYGRDCPKKQRFNVRAVAMEFTDEERQELRQVLDEEQEPHYAVDTIDESSLVEDFIDDQ